MLPLRCPTHLKEQLEQVHDAIPRLLPEARLVFLGGEGGQNLGEGERVHAGCQPGQSLASYVQEDRFPKSTPWAGEGERLLEGGKEGAVSVWAAGMVRVCVCAAGERGIQSVLPKIKLRQMNRPLEW